MAKFVVVAQVTISIFTEVEADTEEQALKEAEERALHGLCYQCGGFDTKGEEWCTSGELDGTPTEIKIRK